MDFFYFFSFFFIISGLLVIGSINPIHSIMSLILVFCNAAGFLILLEIEFIAMILIVVYVGAIAILFLFVVMMLNIKVLELDKNILIYLPISNLIGIIFLVELFLIINNEFLSLFNTDFINNIQLFIWAIQITYLTNIELLGLLLYTYYSFLFLMSSIILLVAMVGAIVLTLYKEYKVKRQDISDQMLRKIRKFYQKFEVIKTKGGLNQSHQLNEYL